MAIAAKRLTYVADGVTMIGDFFADGSQAAARPGVLVYPDARGLDDVARRSARRLAEVGFAALACDLYGDGRYIADADEAIALARPMAQNPQVARRRAQASFDALVGQTGVDPRKVAAIGYCFGGNIAVELARGGADLLASIAFHGGVVAPSPDESRKIKGKVLICTGAEDPYITVEQRAAFEKDMSQSGVDWRMHVYGQVFHSFTNPEADKIGKPEASRYDAGADARSWTEMLSLLQEVFA
jgi:dienelactone hydrolase